MNKKYLYPLILFLILTSISIIIVISYPKKDSLENFAFNDFNHDHIYRIEMHSTNFPNTYVCLKDSHEIPNLLSQLKNVKLEEFIGNLYTNEGSNYSIYIVNKDTYEELNLYVIGNKYIQIDCENYKNPKKYKILDDSFNFNYLNELLSKYGQHY